MKNEIEESKKDLRKKIKKLKRNRNVERIAYIVLAVGGGIGIAVLVSKNQLLKEEVLDGYHLIEDLQGEVKFLETLVSIWEDD